MPIGNLSSQLFANLYLNELDQFVKHQLRIKNYIRYMDDIVAFHPDKKFLHQARREIERFLDENLRLILNNKTAIRPVHIGVEFCGFKIWATHRKIRKGTIKKIKGRLKYLQRAYAREDITTQQIHASVQSFIGYMKHANTFNLRKRIFERAVFTKGNPEKAPHFCQKS